MNDLLQDKALLLHELKNWFETVRPTKLSPLQHSVKRDSVTLNDKLILAIHFNSEDEIKRLLDIGADPNALSEKGFSVFQLALAYQREESVLDLLIEYGAK
ncbi:MAG TPA: hypothetical protein VFP93_04180, partial [Gammaproteobacteria bacterium]|nr:hypothetical protein [Gammaproteobacteria bacterium]